MKKIFKIWVFLSIFIILLTVVRTSYAQTNIPQMNIPKMTSLNQDYFAAGSNVDVTENVTGDAYVAGGNVRVNSEIKGDLLVAGGSVTVNGKVDGNIRGAGGNISIDGIVGKNVTIAGGNVTVSSSAVIGGNVTGAFGQFDYLGKNNGGISIAGGNLNINGPVGTNVYAQGNEISVGKNAQIGGDFNYQSPQKAKIADNAQISGNTKYTPLQKRNFGYQRNRFLINNNTINNFKIGASIVGLITSFIIGFILLKIFPVRMDYMGKVIQDRPVRTVVAGIVLLFLSPFIVLVLLFTFLGIPLAIMWILAVIIMIYLSKIVVGYWLGKVTFRAFNQGERRGWALLVGLVLIYIGTFIPFIGWLDRILVLLVGLGAIILDEIYFFRDLSAKKLL